MQIIRAAGGAACKSRVALLVFDSMTRPRDLRRIHGPITSPESAESPALNTKPQLGNATITADQSTSDPELPLPC